MKTLNVTKGTNDDSFSEGMLKGRMAETLVEELLKKSGNTVYRFGFEAIMQNLTQIKKSFDAHSDAGKRIRAIPDFIVIDASGNPMFVEVKFRRHGKLHKNDRERLDRIGSFWSAKIVFVNSTQKPFFKVSSAPYVGKNGELICQPMTEQQGWKIDPVVYDEFETLVERYLAPQLNI